MSKRLRVIYQPKGAAREYSGLAANLYQGCSHACSYCYSPGVLRKTPAEFHRLGATPREDILANLEHDAAILPVGSPRILLCFACDPYQPGATITREAIQILRAKGHKISILTKGGERAAQFGLFLPRNPCYDVHFGATVSTYDPNWTKKNEPGAASPFERLCVLRDAHATNISTWLSVEPVFNPAEALEVIEMAAPFVDYFRVGKLNHHPDIERKIDWGKFAFDVIELARRLKLRLYIKDALAKHLEGIPEEYRRRDE